MNEVIQLLKGGLIVSCQITDPKGHFDPDNPINGPTMMALTARSAEVGGACGLRVDGVKDISAVKRMSSLPIIGIYKMDIPGYEVRITPTIDSVVELVKAGAEIVAVDATDREHPGKLNGADFIKHIKRVTDATIMADVSNEEEGVAAAGAGADIVATTLAGYTEYTRSIQKPDFELVTALANRLSVPVICEGGISSPEQAREALERGAHAVVVGTMIINVKRITQHYVRVIRKSSSK